VRRVTNAGYRKGYEQTVMVFNSNVLFLGD